MPAMRWIDHWVGLPLCFMLGLTVTLLRKLGARRSRSVAGTRTLAVFKFFGLGSIMEATPLLRAVRAQYPQARLVFVTLDSNAALVRSLNVCTDVRAIRTRSLFHFVLDVLGQVVWFWRHGTEAVIDLEFFSKFSTLLSFFSGARVRIGFHLNDFWRYSLVTHPIYFNYYRHITDVYAAAAKRLGVTIRDTRLSRIAVPDTARQSVRQFLTAQGWSPEALLVGLNVNAGDMSLERRWPLPRFGVVAQTLLQRHADLRLVLVGSAAERAYVSSLLAHVPAELHSRLIVAAGRWSLEEFVAALAHFDLFITNDSGPMHIAAAQDTPIVSLWGPARPAFIAPQVENHRVIYRDYPCSPCLLMFTSFEGMWCNHEGWCMQEIEPRAVLDAAEDLLAQARTRRLARAAAPAAQSGTEL